MGESLDNTTPSHFERIYPESWWAKVPPFQRSTQLTGTHCPETFWTLFRDPEQDCVEALELGNYVLVHGDQMYEYHDPSFSLKGEIRVRTTLINHRERQGGAMHLFKLSTDFFVREKRVVSSVATFVARTISEGAK